jgi:hypothetical protein
MAALINALDNHTPLQHGEKGHVEYGWSNNIQEKILQFNFQLTRTDELGVKRLEGVLKDILTNLKTRYENENKTATISEKELVKGYLSILYRMIGQTRDIIDGKGECTLTYMMICTWYDFYPVLANFALKCLVDLDNSEVHQFGSWKDIKYFGKYCLANHLSVSHPLIQYACLLVNEQLQKDLDTIAVHGNISLAAKWVPREKSSFGWLYESLACQFFSNFLVTAETNESRSKAVTKCKTQYRKLLSDLNRRIDTTQIKQCGGDWSNIDFNKVTSVTTHKQKKAFLNIKKDGSVRYSDNKDRIECAEHFQARIKKAVDGEVEMKGKRISMADFTKQALNLIHQQESYLYDSSSSSSSSLETEINLLNSQWRDNSSQTGALDNMIPMVDVSGSMGGDPMNVAIALGLRIAEKSTLGKRIMTFSAKPTWVNLESYDDFVTQVSVVKKAEWGMNTNFHLALDMILDAIIQNKMAPEDVQNMVLVILSDMQMDAGDRCDKKVLYETMEAKYASAGVRVHGKPYKPPHILFWNLRSTSGFPSLSNQANCSMMSGFSPALLNLFCEKGMDAFESCTPWSILEQSLENKRYKIMSDKLEEFLGLDF